MDSGEQEDMFITCEACDLRFTSIKPFEQHVRGKKHKKQVEDKRKQIQVKSQDEDSSLEEKKESEIQDFTCDVCEAAFSGIIPYSQHLKSKPHAKALRRKQAEGDSAHLEDAESNTELLDDDADLDEMLKKVLPEAYGSCSICEKQFNGPECYSQHLKSKFHAKRKTELKLLKKIKSILSTSEISDSEGVIEDRKEENGCTAAEEQEELICKDCDKIFTGAFPFAQHVTSKAHKKRECQNKLLRELEAIKMMELEDVSSSSDEEVSSEVLTCEICNMSFSGPENLKAHVQSKKHQKAVKWKKYLAKKEKSIDDGSRGQITLKDNPGSEDVTEKKDDSPSNFKSTGEAEKGGEPLETATT